MPPRPEDAAVHGGTAEVNVRLVDVEPLAGLVSAVSMLCVSLTNEAVEAMPETAQQHLTDIQAILWRLQHRAPERPELQEE